MPVMSPERPPSQNSVGGNGGNIIEPTNMVLSTIPIESGHVVIHHQPSTTAQTLTNGNTYTQIIRNGTQNLISTVSNPQLVTKVTAGGSTAPSPSKYVVIHQNGNGQYRASDGTTYLTTQSTGPGGGNIVFLSAEPMEVPNAEQNLIVSTTNGTTTDEDLTSLTWLQDKNLLKDLVVRTNGKTTTTTVAATASVVTSPIRQSNGVVTVIGNGTSSTAGPLSPTSDFMEDSSVSEDNVSSINSSSDQGISISSAEYSPIIGTNTTAFTTYQPGQYHTIATAVSNGSAGHYINNNTLTKNRNHIMSPNKTPITATIAPATIVESGTTKTVLYNGPSGTTTVVEYKTGTNFSPPPIRHISATNNSAILSPQRSPPPSINSVTISSSAAASPTSSSSSLSSLSSTTSSASSTARHQHFHKKYIREQLNGGGGISILNGSTMEERNSSNSIEQNGIPIATQYLHQPPPQNFYTSNINEPEDYHHRTPIKTETVLYDSTGAHEEVINARESLNFTGSPNADMNRTSAQKTLNTTSSSSTSSSSTLSSAAVAAAAAAASPKQKHPTNVPYDPLVHTTNKPPYSFSSLIFMAIEDSPEKALPVKEIYAWIVQHFPYFKTAPTGWKNSVRHNLSLNKSFLKVEKAPNMGKGSLWRVEDQQRPNLLQALARSPFHQCSTVDKFSPYKQGTGGASTPSGASSRAVSESPPETSVKSNLDPKLFPKLSKTMKDMVTKGGTFEMQDDRDDQQGQYPFNGFNGINGNVNNGRAAAYYATNGNADAVNGNGGGLLDYSIERLARDCGADSIDDVHAATAMLALKHGPNVFTEHFQNGSPVITSSPSEDHTYSAGGGGGSGGNSGGSNGTTGGGGGATDSGTVLQNGCSDNNSSGICSDAAYESGDERSHRAISAEELEEQRRHAEGVDALLSFASSAASSPAKRPSSTPIDDEHFSSYTENIPHYILPQNGIGSGPATRLITTEDGETILYHRPSSSSSSSAYDTPPNSYYHHLPVAITSTAKKIKVSRNIRSKSKKKTTLMR